MKYLFCALFVAFAFSNILAQAVLMKVNLSDGSTTEFPIEDIQKITFSGVTDIEISDKTNNLMKTFTLFQNYPNPFNPTTTIQYQLPKAGSVMITIFAVNGQKIKEFEFHSQTAGTHTLVWDATNDSDHAIASGLYIYKVKFDDSIIAKKMIFVK